MRFSSLLRASSGLENPLRSFRVNVAAPDHGARSKSTDFSFSFSGDLPRERACSEISLFELTPSSAPTLRSQASHVIASSFCGGPASKSLARFLKIQNAELYPIWRQITDVFLAESMEQSIALVAVDQQSLNNVPIVAGCLLCRNFYSPPPPLFALYMAHSILQPLHRRMIEAAELYKTALKSSEDALSRGATLSAWQVATHPDYRQQKIMENLMQQAMHLAKNRGYRRVVAQVTGAISQQGLNALGFVDVVNIPWKSGRLDDPFRHMSEEDKDYVVMHSALLE